jgi:hypothetical protein
LAYHPKSKIMLRVIYLLTTMAVTAISSLLSAQNTQDRIAIKGVVYSEQKLSVNTVISLLLNSNQSLVKTELLSENGAFAFENVAKGITSSKFLKTAKPNSPARLSTRTTTSWT